MKKAFSMIELVFVIVVIGILAAIVTPKLVGTRTDAKLSALKENVRTINTSIQSYSKQKMLLSGNMDEESNYPDNLNTNNNTNLLAVVLQGADTSSWELVDKKYYAYKYKLDSYGTFYFGYAVTSGAINYLKTKNPSISWSIGDFKCYGFEDNSGKANNNKCKELFN